LAYDVVVLNPNRNGLRVAKSIRRRMTTAAGVVGMQSARFIEPQQPSKVSEFSVDLAAKPRLKRGFDSSGKSGLLQRAGKRDIEALLRRSRLQTTAE
jgi:hypothetical protein